MPPKLDLAKEALSVISRYVFLLDRNGWKAALE